MIDKLLDSLYNFSLNAIDCLPDVNGFDIPDIVYDGIGNIFQFVGLLMPYQVYLPLITFILSLTAFRIAYSVYLHFKK